jgi:aspartyl-tRNA synthetase
MLDTYSEEWKRTHEGGLLTIDDVGESVVLNGWVKRRRDLGGLIFLELRNRTGVIQVVCDPAHNDEAAKKAHQVRSEFVIGVKGTVKARTEETINEDMPTGTIEVLADSLAVFNSSDTTPFEIKDDTNANEDLRLQYRYLDLRRPRLQKNMMLRHSAALAIRNFLSSEGFLEIETPILTRSTPEGARDYLVPSRNYKGSFYALPQSPQLFKQLLMVSGYDRYFQIARCFRDEDFRADRQPEFTQVDIELSFVEPDDIYDLIERMLAEVFGKIDVEVNLPFPIMSWHDAMNTYGSDKPDLRFDLTIEDLSDAVAETEFKVLVAQSRKVEMSKVFACPAAATCPGR